MLDVSSCLRIRAVVTHTSMFQTLPACFTAEEQAAVESVPSTEAVARQYDALIRRHGPYPFFLVQLGIHHRFMNTQTTSVALYRQVTLRHFHQYTLDRSPASPGSSRTGQDASMIKSILNDTLEV